MTRNEKSAELLKLLGNATRLRILFQLQEGTCCVTDICRRLKLPQAKVSQHLSLLRGRGIVTAERQGARVCYTLSDQSAGNILRALVKKPKAREKR